MTYEEYSVQRDRLRLQVARMEQVMNERSLSKQEMDELERMREEILKLEQCGVYLIVAGYEMKSLHEKVEGLLKAAKDMGVADVNWSNYSW